jgi:hypothetical protein
LSWPWNSPTNLYESVINRQQRLSSCNFHRFQTHPNRPILYIGLIVKYWYKTILFLKSKNLTCGTCSWLIVKFKSSINDIEDSYISYHKQWQKGIKSYQLIIKSKTGHTRRCTFQFSTFNVVLIFWFFFCGKRISHKNVKDVHQSLNLQVLVVHEILPLNQSINQSNGSQDESTIIFTRKS